MATDPKPDIASAAFAFIDALQKKYIINSNVCTMQTPLPDDTVTWCGVIFTRYAFGSCGTLSHLFDRLLKEAMDACTLDDW